MKRYIFYVSLVLLVVFIFLIAASRLWEFDQNKSGKVITSQYVWSDRASLAIPRSEMTAAALENQIYVIGGFDAIVGELNNIVEVYDISQNSWKRGPDFPVDIHHPAAAVVDGMMYVTGGFTGGDFETPLNTVYMLDDSGVWTVRAPMTHARGAHALVAFDGMLYVIGGVSAGGEHIKEMEQYDPDEDTWSDVTILPTVRDHLSAVVINRLIYIAGGRTFSLERNVADLDIYDPVADIWMSGPRLPTPRGGSGAGVVDGMFILVGGETTRMTYGTVEAYDPVTQKWIYLPDLPQARHGAAAATVDGQLFIIGGARAPRFSYEKLTGRVSALQIVNED